MHHLRRHAHRVAKAPRSTWRRTFRYQERPSGWPFGPLRVTTPMSEDAPYGDEDARFWDWIAATLLAAIGVAVVVWLIVTFG